MAPIYTTRLDTSQKEIRLLELLPANNLQEPIQCRLYTTQLSMETEYTALSYVWGDPKATSPITVNGLPFQATHNLCAALRRIRSKSNLPTTLWVDAICINQSDNDEKSPQVQLMRDIYYNASLVTVWLGESDKYTEEAIVLIKLTASLLKCAWGKGEKQCSLDYVTSRGASALFKDDSRFIALREFFSRPWWSRVWVVQEVVVSRHAKIICGTTEILWEDLQQAYTFWAILDHKPDNCGYDEEAKQKLEHVLRKTKVLKFLKLILHRDLPNDQVVQDGVVGSFPGLRIRNHVENDLQASLIDGHFLEASNPRDKVYAWLGLFQVESDDLAIVPDYNASTAQVYVNALKTVMQLTGSLSLMVLSAGLNHSQSPIPNLPSWAPDFRHDNLGESSWGSIISYRASASEMARATILPDGKVLRADTHVVDHIQLTDADKNEKEGWKLAEKLCRWMYLVLQHRTHIHTSAVMALHTRKLLPKELFAAVACLDHDIPQDNGYPFLKLFRTRGWRATQRLWAGFMAYSGYLDRLQDIAQWCKEHQSCYCGKLQPGHQPTSSVYHNMVAVRPAVLNIRHPRRSKRRPPKPHVQDEENTKRFCRLWGLPEDKKPPYFEYENKKADSLNCNKENTTSTDALEFAERAAMFTAEKTFFITKLGFLGSGPQTIQPDHSLAIIRGCCMPLVIRKHSDGDGSFEVVGKCYVGALMDGKYIENLRNEGKLKWEELRFR